MPDSVSKTSGLDHVVKTAQRAGLTRDLPYGPEDLPWVANSATLLYGTDDAVLVDTFTSIGQNAELKGTHRCAACGRRVSSSRCRCSNEG